jgi:hypothetical protein
MSRVERNQEGKNDKNGRSIYDNKVESPGGAYDDDIVWAIVDADMYEKVSGYNWTLDSTGSAMGCVNGRRIAMHKLIMKDELDIYRNIDTVTVCHMNHNKLDNRICNLRVCCRLDSRANRLGNAYKKMKGVSKNRNTWSASIMQDRLHKQLGTFDTQEKAARAYDRKAKELYGKYAYLNYMENDPADHIDETKIRRIAVNAWRFNLIQRERHSRRMKKDEERRQRAEERERREREMLEQRIANGYLPARVQLDPDRCLEILEGDS